MGRNEKDLPKGKVLGVDLLIFVTLGTQDKHFKRLLEAVEKLDIDEKIVAQVGSTDFLKKWKYISL